MRFTDQFKITRRKNETWFDPVLSIDTLLFIDPFLVYAQEHGPFRGSHREIIRFFNYVFKLVAQSGGNEQSPLYLKAVQLLIFPEREELCLGYTKAGTKGSGSGLDLARTIADAIWEAIQAGIKEIKHFEEVAILREGIGADRISDIAAGLLLQRLAAYTESVCRKHHVPCTTVRFQRGKFDVAHQTWLPLKAKLPRNPYNKKSALLVPEHYLAALPTINPEDFWDYCGDRTNELLRSEFSYDVTRRVSKRDIIEFARRRPQLLEQYIGYREQRAARPYNLKKDEKGLIRWYETSKSYAERHPLSLHVASAGDFAQVVDQMVLAFRHFVEENAGWRLLWNDNRTNKSEEASQLLFLGIVKHYCHANDIDISPEPNIGRGPVDFKASRGFQYRALLELKLAKNTKFWRGLRKQLPAYMKAEQVTSGYFIVVLFSDEDEKRVSGIRRAVRDVNTTSDGSIQAVVVDARRGKISASKL